MLRSFATCVRVVMFISLSFPMSRVSSFGLPTVAMVLSGHIHMSWPYSVSQRQSQLGVYYPPAYGGTAIVIAPAAGAGAPIKQVIAAVGLTEGSSALTLSAYTMAYDGSSISLANTQTISLPHPVTFRALQ